MNKALLTTVLALLICTTFLPRVLAQDVDGPPALRLTDDSETNRSATLVSDFQTIRGSLQESGIEFGLSATLVFQQNAHGGLRTHNGHRVTGSIDYELTFDLEAMRLWDGGKVYVAAESSWVDGIGEDLVGSVSPVNGDAAGDYSIFVTEMWYEHVFWDGRARVKVGKIDVSADIDANAYANDETSQFLNFSLINTLNIPAPEYGLAAVLVMQPADWFYMAIGAADKQADGRQTGFNTTFHDEDYFLSGIEFGLMPVWKTARGKLPGAYRFGIWYDPRPKEMFFDDLGGRRRTIPFKRDDVGGYFNMDQMLIKELPEDNSDSQGLGMFIRYGFADGEANPIEHFWSVGAQYQGLIPGRDDDVFAFGFSQMIMSDKLREINGVDRESVYEMYYNMEVFPWLSVTPDIQYIDNPGAFRGRDSLIAGLRIQMSF